MVLVVFLTCLIALFAVDLTLASVADGPLLTTDTATNSPSRASGCEGCADYDFTFFLTKHISLQLSNVLYGPWRVFSKYRTFFAAGLFK